MAKDQIETTKMKVSKLPRIAKEMMEIEEKNFFRKRRELEKEFDSVNI